jgi:hypothetical protein
VLIVGERRFDSLCFHDQEAGAIGKTPVLVSPKLVTSAGSFELTGSLRDHRHMGIRTKRPRFSRGRRPQARTMATESVEELHQNHFSLV